MKTQKVYYMLMAQDMDRAVKFYTGTVGLKVDFQSPDWTELKWGDAVVALHGGWDGKPNRTSLGFQVADINAACEMALSAGATITKTPSKREDEPIYLAGLRDTEGNEIMLSQYVG